MELIDRGALLEQVDDLAVSDCEVFRAEALRLIADAPTIDAVAVVRCRDCVFSHPVPKYLEQSYHADRVLVCEIQRGDEGPHGLSMTWKNGFCDEGRRMDADAPEQDGKDVNVNNKDAPERAGKDGRDG